MSSLTLRSGLTLWQWRREVSETYAAVRRTPNPVVAHEAWAHRRAALLRDHPQSPLETGAAGPFLFAYDPAFRFLVDLVEGDGSETVLGAGADGEVRLTAFARTDGLAPALGGELTLYWIEGYGGGVFLPFGDATNGRETYGGGRYLLDTIKGADLGQAADGRTVLDFNFAYFPSCAYSDRYVCPLSPRGNRVSAAITAGERHP